MGSNDRQVTGLHRPRLLLAVVGAIFVSLVLGGMRPAGAEPPPEARVGFVGAPDAGGNGQIFTARPDGSGRSAVGIGGQNPDWDISGHRLAYDVNTSGGHLLYVDDAGGRCRHGAVPNVKNGGPAEAAISPDGTRLAFTVLGTGARPFPSPELWTSRLDGSGARAVLTENYNGDPEWTPDGSRISFTHLSGPSIATVRPDGTGLRLLTASTPGAELNGSWSPDGSRLLYSGGSSADRASLFVSRSDGGSPVEVVPATAGEYHRSPAWSPDGRMIAFQSIGGDGASLPEGVLTAIADGSNVRLVAADGRMPTWVPGTRRADAGYRMVAADGGLFTFGAACFHGSAGGTRLNQPVVGGAASLNPERGRDGYWLVASDGGIFAFGNAAFHGSTGALKLNQPIVGMAATPTGAGYWLVASDGGIFAFGDAAFHGSTGALKLNQPIVGMAVTPTGAGYWLVASDGGIFAFGDAAFHGSTGAIALNRPVVGLASTPSAGGYWLVASDGGIFAFGDAAFHGSTGAIALNQPVVGMQATSTGAGYRLVARDGGVFAFGDSPYAGSAGAIALVAPVVAVVTG